MLSLEGADSIVTPRHLEQSYAEGLRAIGPVHYGPGVFGMGTDAEGPLTPRGYTDVDIDGIFHGNVVTFLRRALPG